MVKIKYYLIGIEKDNLIIYKLINNKDAMQYKYWFNDTLSKPEFLLELPTKKTELKKSLDDFMGG